VIDRANRAHGGAPHRLTLATGEVRKIDAPPLPSADGIVMRGNTLHVARCVNNEITTVRLCDAAVSGDRLLVNNPRWTPTSTARTVPITQPVLAISDAELADLRARSTGT
jgi:hypothetical protein